MAEEANTVKVDDAAKVAAQAAATNTNEVKNEAATNAAVQAAAVENKDSAASASKTLLPETTKAEAVKSDWPEYKDESLGAASKLLKDAGLSYVDGQSFFEKSRASGKLEDIDLKAMEAKIGKEKTTLVMAGIRDYYNKQVDATKQTVSNVLEVMGGKDSFTKVKAWVAERESAEPAFASEMKEIRSMLDEGGIRAKAAALHLMSLYNKNPNNSGLNTKMVDGDKPVTGADGSPLTRKDYIAAMKAAQDKGDKQSIASLNARRKLGMAQKI